MARSFVVIVLAALVTLGICGSALSQDPDRERLRVGATMSITGKAYSVQGRYGREGYLLCQKHLNAQGGLLGKTVEFLIYDDESDEKTAARLYEKLITEDKVDAILGPYGTAITEAVADIPDKYRKVMIAANAATSSIWEKGRKYLIMVLAPVDSAAVGALDLAARNGLKNVAIVYQDALLPKAVAKTTNELARSMGLNVVSLESYPTGTSDFSGVFLKVQQSAPDLLVTAAVRIDDLMAMIRQMRVLNFDTKMVSSLPYGLLPEFYQLLGKDAEFVYSATFWDGSLPNPGNPEFVAAYQKEFNRAPAVQSANSYAGCQIFAEAVRQAGTTESEKLRDALLSLKTRSVLGDFAVDQRGFQIGQKAVTIQWQDGRQAVVWPDGLGPAPRFPTPNWASR
ncbi:amino acid ABC transporter substrate-binding protein [Bradyrhizobium sp. Arg816]|uniref:amino acid ABC transporter substrate-binding protein n=1 Tax=Bradyrhizobium sp. Arg816 TaxID=2998491 RepID=UPI00249EED12|nr:amino acid ABC transporter substrate-binding protein [Bradyrhizobium sp. Arg816]MDI3561989.1 amino acid ABC transporter substrate-binding protein [Bradyrhizobium sp. Arg816]